jgi:hypothetical protein
VLWTGCARPQHPTSPIFLRRYLLSNKRGSLGISAAGPAGFPWHRTSGRCGGVADTLSPRQIVAGRKREILENHKWIIQDEHRVWYRFLIHILLITPHGYAKLNMGKPSVIDFSLFHPSGEPIYRYRQKTSRGATKQKIHGENQTPRMTNL